MNPLRALQKYGQSVWYDNITRTMLTSGELAQLVEHDGLRGITSNPTIFEKAINGSSDYDETIAELLSDNPRIAARELFFSLAIQDIQAAADIFLPVYRDAKGHDGLVSLEVSPDLAYDTDGTIAEARRLWQRVNRPNLMIKVPATKESLPAVETLTAEGINVNVTLLFSVERYCEVVDAYLSGLETRMRSGQHVDHVASVASFFVSRVDSAVDKQLRALPDNKGHACLGKTAVANAKVAYQSYLKLYGGERFAALRDAGAKTQRLLWASTGTKSADYSDVLYIDELIGDRTVTTVPPATYNAFKDHGNPLSTLAVDVESAQNQLNTIEALGVDLDSVTEQLEDDGVKAFADSFDNLVATITSKTNTLRDKLATTA